MGGAARKVHALGRKTSAVHYLDKATGASKKVGFDIEDPGGYFKDADQQKHVPNLKGAGDDATQAAMKQQQDFIKALAAQNGITNQANVFGQQQTLANRLNDMSQGIGPNPALEQLRQQTGQNVSNQAALMAAQRGASANPALIARQAAMQGSGIQQNAVGQEAVLQAQQQMAATQDLQQQQANMAGLSTAQVGQQQSAIGTAGQQALTREGILTGQQTDIAKMNAQIDAANMAAQRQADANLTGAIGTGVGMFFGGPAGAKAGGALSGALGNQLSQPGAGSSFGGTSSDFGSSNVNSGTMPGTLLNSDSNRMGAAAGGMATKHGMIGPGSSYGKHLKMANGGQVPALVSPGEVYLNPSAVQEVQQGKRAPMDGEKIPGKAKVKGAKNSYSNDTIPKTLEEGGIVLPRSVTQAKHPHWEAKKFVEAILAKNKHSKK